MRLLQMCQWAGVDAEVEVFNLFAGSILLEGLRKMERGRKVQSIIPDMRISLSEEGNLVKRLHKIKLKIAIYCPQGSGTLRQQLLM